MCNRAALQGLHDFISSRLLSAFPALSNPSPTLLFQLLLISKCKPIHHGLIWSATGMTWKGSGSCSGCCGHGISITTVMMTSGWVHIRTVTAQTSRIPWYQNGRSKERSSFGLSSLALTHIDSYVLHLNSCYMYLTINNRPIWDLRYK